MLSQAWSTSELKDGISHILADGQAELPDDIGQLEENHPATNLPYDHSSNLSTQHPTRFGLEEMEKALAELEAKEESARVLFRSH